MEMLYEASWNLTRGAISRDAANGGKAKLRLPYFRVFRFGKGINQ